jgi:polyhydroxybutyrate depolymerase
MLPRSVARITTRTMVTTVALLGAMCALLSSQAGANPSTAELQPLAPEPIRVQGLHRTVRLMRPARLSERPALVIVLHGSGGDGERIRRLTAGAFERLAEEHGWLVAYPDALGRHWQDCRARAPWHAALAGVDDLAFLRAVARYAAEIAGRELTGVFAVGFSNGGHLLFRAALEDPGTFRALAVIAAHLPVADERDCTAGPQSIPMYLISGTDDPINPWHGGEVLLPGGVTFGSVLSGEATAGWFRDRAGLAGAPIIEHHTDMDPEDGTRVETRRWRAGEENEVVHMIVHGGGHTLPHPAAAFPADQVGRTSRDLDGAAAIWHFFLRHLPRKGVGDK